MDRREFLKAASAAALAEAVSVRRRSPRPPKTVVVVGAGIGGLTTAYELHRRGHEVTVLEAASDVGGHVRTRQLAHGLYVDLGAEHFSAPGYEYYRGLIAELELPVLPYPRRIGMHAYEEGGWVPIPQKRSVSDLLADGFSQREARFLAEGPERSIRDLYFKPYIDRFDDEYDPFATGLGELDVITVTELLRREGASEAAVASGGGEESALQAIWHDAILHLRGVPPFPRNLFRIQGGNHRLPHAMADLLGDRVLLGRRVERVAQGEGGVTVEFRVGTDVHRVNADYVVLSIPLPMIPQIESDPPWPVERLHVFGTTSYYTGTRLIFQTSERFWEDGTGPNLVFNRPALYETWSMAEEVDTPKGLLVGYTEGAATAAQAYAVLSSLYPESLPYIESIDAFAWPLDPHSPVCERRPFGLGELSKVWPLLIEPFGRIHFASSATDNLYWGMEAATRAALRTATTIDAA